MSRLVVPTAPASRLTIRASDIQKSVLSRAARARHMNLGQFVLQASLTEARRAIQGETQLLVSAEEYEHLCRVMDEATPAPRLRAALAEKPVWDV